MSNTSSHDRIDKREQPTLTSTRISCMALDLVVLILLPPIHQLHLNRHFHLKSMTVIASCYSYLIIS